jgi:polyisoprenyl-phosphate glycosyltransferase
MSDKLKISIVIPVFNEEANIRELFSRLMAVINRTSTDVEILFVDDGSRDETFNLIKKLHDEDKRVKGISLSRNFGHQVALFAGIKEASGEVTITMDGDLQHPPEVIIDLIEKFSEGFDIVNTRRLETSGENWFKRKSSSSFYRILNMISSIKVESGFADFRLMNRKAVDAFLQFPERDRFTRGLISWMGFRQAMVDYVAPQRFQGKSKYSTKKMLRLAIDGITSFSSRPLRISFYTGIVIFLLGLLYAVFAVVDYFRGNTIQGWTSILVSVLILGGFQLLMLGVVGEYIARIFNETKSRPLYFIKDKTES